MESGKKIRDILQSEHQKLGHAVDPVRGICGTFLRAQFNFVLSRLINRNPHQSCTGFQLKFNLQDKGLEKYTNQLLDIIMFLPLSLLRQMVGLCRCYGITAEMVTPRCSPASDQIITIECVLFLLGLFPHQAWIYFCRQIFTLLSKTSISSS